MKTFSTTGIKPELVIDEFGIKKWLVNGRPHREDGPAIEFDPGYKAWYFNGKKHRSDGHAIEYPSGTIEYWLDGKEYTELQFFMKTGMGN